jgi:Cu+-exporting ATPase
MFNLFKKKLQGSTIKLKLSGLHCVSCSLNIDGALEDTPGVISANTSYAKQETAIEYDPARVKLSTLRTTIESLGYQVL